MMTKQRKNSGFTLAEMLIVVAITIILMGVAFIAVQNHQRSMTRLEFDSIAKEIFVAAQNHLTSAQGQGYMNLSDDKRGTPGESKYDTQGERYFLYNTDEYSSDPQKAESVLDLMLPFGSIDETVRAGGRYIIRYQPSSGRVLDVFYSLPGRSSMLTVSGKELNSSDYKSLMENCRDDGNLKTRENYRGGVVGWYGGEEGLPTGMRLNPPELIVHNEEVLWVEIKDTNPGVGSLKLIITGAVSNVQRSFSLPTSSVDPRVIKNGSPYKVVIDDITSEGFHFADLTSDDGSKHFIPGEDIIVEAVAFNNKALSNIAYSGKKTTNSLFSDFEEDMESTTTKHVAVVDNFRHFENLDVAVSGFRYDGIFKDGDKFESIGKAIQVKDLNWTDSYDTTPSEKPDSFIEAVEFITEVKPSSIYLHADSTDIKGSTESCLYPVSPAYVLGYNGQNHKIANVKVSHSGNAGLFGTLSASSTVSNLELIDFDVKTSSETSSGNAGALVGTVTGTTITNVLAYNDKTTGTSATVTASSGDAGGLIGSATNCEVTKCAAALVVSGSANAGGLIGSSTGGKVEASYSGGHTYSGAPTYSGSAPSPARTPNAVRYYDSENKPIYNVTGSTTAGGLIGNAVNTTITNSYSTCSAKGATAGGFVGSFVGTGTDDSISGSYCTGLVSGKTEGAFAGSLTGTASGCKYFEIINERQNVDENDKTKVVPGYHYLTALGENKTSAGITAFDDTAATYEAFCGTQTSWKPATPYDGALKTYYLEKYNLQTIGQLLGGDDKLKESESDETVYFVATHYGDWPAPEEFVFNETA